MGHFFEFNFFFFRNIHVDHVHKPHVCSIVVLYFTENRFCTKLGFFISELVFTVSVCCMCCFVVSETMETLFNIRLHYMREQYMIPNVNPSRYTYAKLLSDLDEQILEDLHCDDSTLFFTLMADTDNTFEQIEILSDHSVKQMFELNMTRKEVELHLSTDFVKPLAVDNSGTKNMRENAHEYDIDVEYVPSKPIFQTEPSARRRLFRRCKPRPPPQHPP